MKQSCQRFRKRTWGEWGPGSQGSMVLQEGLVQGLGEWLPPLQGPVRAEGWPRAVEIRAEVIGGGSDSLLITCLLLNNC